MLYIVATPIGNLEDLTLRALRILGEVDVIACEDTRHTRKLLTHYKITAPLISYHEHNERGRAAELVQKMQHGLRVALVSDAGMPLVCDPGFFLVREALQQGIPVIPIPGASALLTALAASGLPTTDFFFGGFLPPKPTARRARLAELAALPTTLIFYEAPHRIKQTLEDAGAMFGNRQCVLAREVTKLHEEFLRGALKEVTEQVKARDLKGEMVLLIAAPLAEEVEKMPEKSISIAQEIEALMRAEDLDHKTALKRVARLRGLQKSEAYRLLIAEKNREA
ncbi:MAG: 16S rRNA (cytidine(1402)-2'-O)-methyltransferase [Acidobacteria bacterium]|nr:16S rRNA (cytidine(1402)-2'-O)-methyltransferase [Acidobacteriota bacterium]